MNRRTKFIFAVAVVALGTVATLSLWGMGAAVFLDSERTVLSRLPSPDGKRIASVERIVVGGAPSIVVIVRPAWMPDWYLTGCAAVSHYEDAKARARWTTINALEVRHTEDRRFWKTGSAPFHNEACSNLAVTLTQEAA